MTANYRYLQASLFSFCIHAILFLYIYAVPQMMGCPKHKMRHSELIFVSKKIQHIRHLPHFGRAWHLITKFVPWVLSEQWRTSDGPLGCLT